MVIGILEADLTLAGCESLKDKRRILRSLLEKARTQFHVAAAEVADQDLWKSASLGFSCVANNHAQAESIIQHLVDFLDSNPLVDVQNLRREVISA